MNKRKRRKNGLIFIQYSNAQTFLNCAPYIFLLIIKKVSYLFGTIKRKSYKNFCTLPYINDFNLSNMWTIVQMNERNASKLQNRYRRRWEKNVDMGQLFFVYLPFTPTTAQLLSDLCGYTIKISMQIRTKKKIVRNVRKLFETAANIFFCYVSFVIARFEEKVSVFLTATCYNLVKSTIFYLFYFFFLFFCPHF